VGFTDRFVIVDVEVVVDEEDEEVDWEMGNAAWLRGRLPTAPPVTDRPGTLMFMVAARLA
jgi:hypothetical protein